MKKVLRYFLFYKPYGVLCQFSDTEGRKTLKHFGPFPDEIYPVGRLDADSEGLVLLTNDGELKHFLLEPKYDHSRTYLVQVEHVPTEGSLERLRKGVIIEGRKTKSADVRLLTEDPDLPPRPVPIRYRKNVPTAWLEIILREGKNRQIRKMTAAVNHPTLRLARVAIESFTLHGLKPGEHREISSSEIQKRFGDRFPSY
jgi:23S rRNA pseudouridine2457 synthase